MRIFYIFLIIGIGLTGLGCKTKPPVKAATPNTAKPAPVSLSSLELGILQEVNRYRTSKGLQALKSNSILETEASTHSQRMASKQVPFSHDGYDSRIARISGRLDGIKASAENIAYGRMNAAEVVAFWLKSSEHRRNIEGNYNLSGIGISKNGEGIIYYTQIFSLK